MERSIDLRNEAKAWSRIETQGNSCDLNEMHSNGEAMISGEGKSKGKA